MDWMLVLDQCGVMIFSAFCHQVGKEVLLGPDNFVDLRDGPKGFELHFNCHCGRRGVVYPSTGNLGACEAGDVRPVLLSA